MSSAERAEHLHRSSVMVLCCKHQPCPFSFFFFNDTATTEIYTLSLHDALPISLGDLRERQKLAPAQPRQLQQATQTVLFTCRDLHKTHPQTFNAEAILDIPDFFVKIARTPSH